MQQDARDKCRSPRAGDYGLPGEQPNSANNSAAKSNNSYVVGGEREDEALFQNVQNVNIRLLRNVTL